MIDMYDALAGSMPEDMTPEMEAEARAPSQAPYYCINPYCGMYADWVNGCGRASAVTCQECGAATRLVSVLWI
jgi:hypothetical protein